jgi:hypothetical protein
LALVAKEATSLRVEEKAREVIGVGRVEVVVIAAAKPGKVVRRRPEGIAGAAAEKVNERVAGNGGRRCEGGAEVFHGRFPFGGMSV